MIITMFSGSGMITSGDDAIVSAAIMTITMSSIISSIVEAKANRHMLLFTRNIMSITASLFQPS